MAQPDPIRTSLVGTALVAFTCCLASAQTVSVQPTVETEPGPSSGDAADDPAIWIDPFDPAQSLVIGTDKQSGLAVYDLDGLEVQYLADGNLNNVDVRYDFPLDGEMVDIVAAGNRTNDTIAVYKVNSLTGQLQDVAAGALSVGVNDAYGFCLYHSAQTGDFYAFVNDQDGNVEQWKLFDDGQGLVDASLESSFDVGSQTEGMTADDELGWLYVGEEAVGIWKYGAEPDAGPSRTSVDSTSGHLTADVEGLSIYYASDGTGYLIASSQGSDEFVIYEREGNNDYVMTFQVDSNGGVDGVSGTDGLDVTSVALGSSFPFGVFIAQDNTNSGGNQNYKLVPWDDIAGSGPSQLTVDTSWNPRGQPAFAGARIFWRKANAAANSMWLMDGTTKLPDSGPLPAVSTDWFVAGTGDFNGDGNWDILWRKQNAAANSMWLMDGTTKLPGSGPLPPVSTDWFVAGTGDFDGDGNWDILWRKQNAAANSMWLMDGTTKRPGSGPFQAVASSWVVAGTGLFDTDNNADILWRNLVTGKNSMWFMDGTTKLPASGPIQTAANNWAVAGIGFFNDDDYSDILWRDQVTGSNAMWFMNGITTLAGSGSVPGVASGWICAGTRDFDGDLQWDIMWRNPNNGKNTIWFMDGRTKLPGSGPIQSVATSWDVVGTGN
jgi:3-phytase